MKLHNYIKNIFIFFNSKFLIENNEVKANAISTLITLWDKLMDRILMNDTSVPKIASVVKSELHAFILQLKKNKTLFESNDKRLILSIVALLQVIRVGDIKALLLSDASDVSHLSKIFNEKKKIIIHFPTGKKRVKKEDVNQSKTAEVKKSAEI